MGYLVSATDLTEINLNETDHVKDVLQNVAMILVTRKGTIPLYRDFGLSQDFLDRPIEAAMPLLVSEIKEAVETYEPRAEVEDVSFTSDPDCPGRLIPTVEVIIIG